MFLDRVKNCFKESYGCLQVLDELVQAVLRDVQEMQAGAEQSQTLTLSQVGRS